MFGERKHQDGGGSPQKQTGKHRAPQHLSMVQECVCVCRLWVCVRLACQDV